MPFSKVFQKRHSLNEVSVAKLANEEIEKLKSSFESSKTVVESSLDDEVEFAVSKQRTSESEDFRTKYEYIEKEELDSKSNCEIELRRNSAPPTMLNKLKNSQQRSVSCKESPQEPINSTTRRKKCVSESDTYDTNSEESKTSQGLAKLKESPLENKIGRYLNQLIKESIITAVNSVNVESICEEILGNVPDINNLLKAETEECCQNEEEKMLCNTEECVEKVSENVSNTTSEKNFEDIVVGLTEQEAASLDGYTADLEESISLHSTDMELKKENVENKKTMIPNSADFTSNDELTEKGLLPVKEKHENKLDADSMYNSDTDGCEKLDNYNSTKPECKKIPESDGSVHSNDTDIVLINNVCPSEKVLNNDSSIEQLENTTDEESNIGQLDNTRLLENTIDGESSYIELENIRQLKNTDAADDELIIGQSENTTDDELNIGQPESNRLSVNTTDDELNTGHPENTITDELNIGKPESTRMFENTTDNELNIGKSESTRMLENTTDDELNIGKPERTRVLENTTDDELNIGKPERTRVLENTTDDEINIGKPESTRMLENTTDDELNIGAEIEKSYLMLTSSERDPVKLSSSEPVSPEMKEKDLAERLPQKSESQEEKKHNWKVGYLHVKLPHKTRSKGNLKAWKKRCVSIQPDEFVHDPKNPSLMISVYSAESGSARKHGASFWKSISCQKAVVFRSSSRTHKYAFTISDDNKVVIHLAGESEATSQDWMSAIRATLWPPSPVVQLEKMLYGKEFEVSIIDNDFSLRAGLLGMYGYLTITRKKLILVHPQQGFVIQEWYLNTIDKFELVHQSRIEDVHKVLSMTTCSDSSTGKGEILFYCIESIAMLQDIASTIHQILTEHTKQDGGKYEKELAEMADWLVPAGNILDKTTSEDYYKVPPRQVKSLLDIPNFIFNKPLAVVEEPCSADEAVPKMKSLETTKDNSTRASQDSGISTGNDFLNCSSASFIVGGGNVPEKSSESELSDSYTPPRSPETKSKRKLKEKTNKQLLHVPS